MILVDANLLLYAYHPGALHTSDGDFARFGGLKWRNPLVEG